jgi:osmotically-inducible protein OsmY
MTIPALSPAGRSKAGTLGQLLKQSPEPMPGALAGRFRRFPLLLKFLDVRGALSVQVDPSGQQTSYRPPGETGKTEAVNIPVDDPRSRFDELLLTWDTSMDEDRKLEEAVRKAMVYDKRLSSQPIEISVKEAIVYLTGTVPFYGRAIAAYEVAASVPGVREVSKRLVVEPPGNLTDNEVANYVRAALDAHAEVLKEAITVSVSGGVATLEGSVRDTWQHALAEDIARSARGVRDVHNRLAVDLEQQINDEEISYVIQSAIRHLCGRSGTDVKVAVSDRAVVLSGTVATLPTKEHAERLARIHGALNVRNDIQVMPDDQK